MGKRLQRFFDDLAAETLAASTRTDEFAIFAAMREIGARAPDFYTETPGMSDNVWDIPVKFLIDHGINTHITADGDYNHFCVWYGELRVYKRGVVSSAGYVYLGRKTGWQTL